MRRLLRFRKWVVLGLGAGTCFQFSNCANDLSLLPLQIGVGSYTVPLNATIVNLFNIVTLLISQTVTGLTGS